jgi:hypothetical protein
MDSARRYPIRIGSPGAIVRVLADSVGVMVGVSVMVGVAVRVAVGVKVEVDVGDGIGVFEGNGVDVQAAAV